MVEVRPDGSGALARPSTAGLVRSGDQEHDVELLPAAAVTRRRPAPPLDARRAQLVRLAEEFKLDPAAAAEALSASNEELCTRGCSRWPPHLFLLASAGYFVRGRCGSANLCEYCLMQELHVIRRMLSLQAADGPAPTIVAVLGTGEATWDPAPFYRARGYVLRRLRREFGPDVGYACLSEFTTGKSAYSGGLRRPHWNMLLHGIEVELVDQARELVIPSWCDNAPDTDPAAQYVEPLRDTAAFMRYVANHFTKTAQMPPQDLRWKNKQRFNCSRNYFAPLTRAEAREKAWWSLQREREIVKAHNAGADDPMAVAEAALEELRETSWTLHDRRAVEPMPEVAGLMRRASINEKRWHKLAAGMSNPPGPDGSRGLVERS